MKNQQPFKAISKICLNNWHYIDRKVLTLNEGINFFTGHSGSGKSTVIDAMQIVLYANTDGRGFFNKAAADDSDRSLIEYLRGMVNESQYLRNNNFSSTIVLELEQTDTKEKQCVGVVFDVDTATNDYNRMFFWHTGGILENEYRGYKRCLSTAELREYLQRNFSQEQYYCGPSNERFRRQLYDIYLGGLDMEKFPRLFKRAIPFRMNLRLEDFVKEYICMDQDIHIEDLQESVTQYGRMRNRIEQTMEEISYLEKIEDVYKIYTEKKKEEECCKYYTEKLDILALQDKEKTLRDKIESRSQDISRQEKMKENLMEEEKALQKVYEEILVRIKVSGYDDLKRELQDLNENLERLIGSKARWEKTAEDLAAWENSDYVSNTILWDLEKFNKKSISEEEMTRLQENFQTLKEELEEERSGLETSLRKLKAEENEYKAELKELKQGKKAYPNELEQARYELRGRLTEKVGKFVNVHILADLLDIKDERWHNAVEGYLGNNKLLLVTEPKYAKDAMEIYQNLDRRKYCRVSVLDTEKVLESANKGEIKSNEDSLAKEVIAKEDYIRAYIDFILGKVTKCENLKALRKCKIGITPDCVLYKGFSIQHINPENYTRRAYIGDNSMRVRIRQLDAQCQELEHQKIPMMEELEGIRKTLAMEMLSQPVSYYMDALKDIRAIKKKETRKEEIVRQLQKMNEESVAALEAEKEELSEKLKSKKKQIETIHIDIHDNERFVQKCRFDIDSLEQELTNKDTEFICREEYEEGFAILLKHTDSIDHERLSRKKKAELEPLKEKVEEQWKRLVEARTEYLKRYTNRTFAPTVESNKDYTKLLEALSCDQLASYKDAAKEQARAAVEHFKDDFVYKIRSAIREAYQRRDELNRILSRMDFGKDKYKFVISKNKGPDGRYYSMFMDDSLAIDPSQLTDAMDNQLNMFTMEHEDRYGDMMNELISVFIPPENATREEMETAKRNMEKYADYRTYLSFDMQQIVQGDNDMTIGLSKMIRKNSGGEGQNPLYVALLASFAQLYRINQSVKTHRNSTIRLVVLDEAFSKMDAEKVASCISLIRGLGFQAIISATNDKIQNYLENVDKTFVYANPNKKHISIQEFEKKDFGELEE